MERVCLLLSNEALAANSFALWFYIIELPSSILSREVLMHYIQTNPDLVYAVDNLGRKAINVAAQENILVLNSIFLWHGRYRLLESRPEHISATCYVYKAEDEENKQRVALKLMSRPDHMLREFQTRKKNLSTDYVVQVIRTHPPAEEIENSRESHANIADFESWGMSGQHLTKSQAEQCYCLVMPLANRNMYVALKQDRFAGEKWDEIRMVIIQLIRCVEHLHSKGILHADLKPLNLVRSEFAWQLIDLDAACEIGVDNVGYKSSTAYCPPEAIYYDETADICVLRTSDNLHRLLPYGEDVSNHLLKAHPSFDIWSLGCILYQLCNEDVAPLFQANRDDNVSTGDKDGDSLRALAEWSDATKKKK